MGSYLTPGHTYTDGSTVTGPNLTEHVAEATFKSTAISDQTLRTPATLTDQILVAASGVLYQETLQQLHDLILYPGCVVQTKYAEYTANTNITTVIPIDDTIPQNTEGTEILTATITPRFSTSTILAQWQGQGSISSVNTISVALFKDAIVNALASSFVLNEVANAYRPLQIVYLDSPATTSAITYRVRVGPGTAGTMRLNGTAVQRYHGGAMRSTLVLQEIKV